MSLAESKDEVAAWESWLGPQTKSVSLIATDCAPARGWSRFGIPTDAGDGMAWNREGMQWRFPPDRAVLQLSTAWACVRLLSETISTLPCVTYQINADGTRTPAPDHPLYYLLHDQPNQDMTAVDFWQVLIAWMLLRGVGYAEKDYIGKKIVSLTPLWNPGLSWVYVDGIRIYRYTDPVTGKQRVVPTENMWRIPAFTLGGRWDVSPIAYGANIFEGALAADQASANFFEQGMSASGFVTMPDGVWLKTDQRDQFKRSLQEFSGSPNAGKSFVLEGGAKYNQMTMNPEDAQMLETRNFNVEEICRWFRTPPVMIGHGDKQSSWPTSTEAQGQMFLTYSLRSWIKKIESSIRLSLLAPAEKTKYCSIFGVDSLLRADSKTRADFYQSMTQNGIYTRDECRMLENMPLKGGNAQVLTLQSQNIPIDKLGEPVAAAKPATTAGAPGVQAEALNGPQVTALQALLAAAASGSIPLDTVRATITASYPLLTPDEIAAMITPLVDFTETAPEETDPAGATLNAPSP